MPPFDPSHAATVHTIVIHVVAFLGLSAIYLNKCRSGRGPLVAILSFFLILENLERGNAPIQQRAFTPFSGDRDGGRHGLSELVLAYGWVGGGVLLSILCSTGSCCTTQTWNGAPPRPRGVSGGQRRRAGNFDRRNVTNSWNQTWQSNQSQSNELTNITKSSIV